MVRGETEAIAKAHSGIAAQMKSELEEPLSAFASGLKERRKIIQTGIERLHKTKAQQTQLVNKARPPNSHQLSILTSCRPGIDMSKTVFASKDTLRKGTW